VRGRRTVIWTRHPGTDQCRCCAGGTPRRFKPVWLSAPGLDYGVGAHRFAGAADAAARRRAGWFTFRRPPRTAAAAGLSRAAA